MKNLPSILKPILVQVLVVISLSCKTTGPYPPRLGSIESPRQRVDFSGDWEKNYQSSDDFETVFNEYLLQIQRRIEQIQRRRDNNSSYNISGSEFPSREAVMGLARFTEEITRMPLLHIEQDRSRVKIERKDDFALQCENFNQQISSSYNDYGIEGCSWIQGRMLLEINLRNGLILKYQFTLSPDDQELNITTTVASREVDYPITMSNYYYRYTPPESDFDCIQTLTRNDVCKRTRN